MAQCSAINNALNAKGYSSAQLANQAKLSQDRVDSILAGTTKPTTQEFNAIAGALGLSNAPQHAAKVTA